MSISKYRWQGGNDMSYEKEIKILNINVNSIREKLNEEGADFKGRKEQYLYTYDVPTLYHRYLEIRDLMNTEDDLIYKTYLKKLQELLFEAENLFEQETLKMLISEYKIKNLTDIVLLNKKDILSFVNNQKVISEFKKYGINPNKWIRLRKSNEKVELTVKHILKGSLEGGLFQKVMETEITTSSFEKTNELLENLGLAKRNYQEKIRYSYEYKTAKVEIDIWPMIEPYMEIECENTDIISEIIKKLYISNHEIISCNTEEIYLRKGIDVMKIAELKFDDKTKNLYN